MKRIILISISFLWVLSVLSCKRNYMETSPEPLHYISLPQPAGFPLPNMAADNPISEEGVALGRQLYYDTRLSNDGRSCAKCHKQYSSFSDTIVNSLPHINLAWNRHFLWKGGVEGTLEDAMVFEADSFFQADVEQLQQIETYRTGFKKVFGRENFTMRDIAYALAQFNATQYSINSRVDRYLRHDTMLSASELNGLYIFNTEKGDCFHCHSLGLFTDGQFHNIGLDSIFTGENMGRFLITGLNSDMGKFKTPTLRNVALTPPYMHDGRFKTLEEVVEHYNSGIKHSATLDPIMSKTSFQDGLNLTAQEKTDLVNFLKALTDPEFMSRTSLSKP